MNRIEKALYELLMWSAHLPEAANDEISEAKEALYESIGINVESPQPSAPSVSAEEIEKKVWGMLAILPKESKCHDELLGDCFPAHSVLKAIKLSIEYAQAQQGKEWEGREDLYITCQEDDPDYCGDYSSNDGRSYARLKKFTPPNQ
jgi:hypothetical protein